MWPPRDAGGDFSEDYEEMERSYGVVWKEGSRGPVPGKLELLPRVLRLGAQTNRRGVVIVPLKPGAHGSVSRLLKQGPPFDPGSIEALDRHDVFLTPDEAVFVFESHLGSDALAPLLSDPKLWNAVSAWGEHVAGAPRIAEEAFSWSRSESLDDVSFLPTPGPG